MRIISLLLISILFPSFAVAAPHLMVGDAIPPMYGFDTEGKKHLLTAFEGRPIILEWTSPLCPYSSSRYTSGSMQQSQTLAKEMGAVWVSVYSSAMDSPDYLDQTAISSLAKERQSKAQYHFLDSKGWLGRGFSARTTPYIVIINAAGRIVYTGAPDSNPTAEIEETASRYADDALAQLAKHQSITKPVTRAFGCAIHYAPLGEPLEIPNWVQR